MRVGFKYRVYFGFNAEQSLVNALIGINFHIGSAYKVINAYFEKVRQANKTLGVGQGFPRFVIGQSFLIYSRALSYIYLL